MPVSGRKKLTTAATAQATQAATPTTASHLTPPPAQALPLPTQAEFRQHLRQLATQSVRTFLESVMREELTALLEAQWGEHTPRRKGYRNGYYSRDLITAAGGTIEDLQVPRDRQGEYQTQVFERYSRYEPEVKAGLHQMFIAGVSTHQVGQVAEPLLGAAPSASAVSRIHLDLQGQFEAWQKRPLGEHWCICYLDGVHFTVRHGEKADQLCLLMVLGVDPSGQKEVLGFRSCAEEDKEGWLLLLNDLKRRGVSQVDLIVSDGHDGLIRAVTESFSTTPRQRCLAHKERNVLNAVPKRQRKEVGAELAGIWSQPDKEAARLQLAAFKLKYQSLYPQAVASLEEEAEQSLTFYDFPSSWHRYIRTTNAIESLFSTIRRRTDQVQVFRHEQSCELLVWSVLTAVEFQRVPV